jgi:hypothetical protein
MATGTNKPIGSNDPRDLLANAENIDNFANGQATGYPDRFGIQRKSIKGIEVQASELIGGIESDAAVRITQAIINAGYQYLGDYASGITVSEANQLVKYDGEYWKPSSSTSLPFTTTNWGADSSRFVGVGDAVLREDISLLSGIKDLKPIVGIVQNVKGFYQGSDVGGGQFYYDPSKSKTEHNGGTIIAPEALFLWEGNHSDLETLFNWTGLGDGCFVKQVKLSVLAEDFGGGLNDSTLALLKASFSAKSGSFYNLSLDARSTYNISRPYTGSQRGVPLPNKVNLDGNGVDILLNGNCEWFYLGRDQDFGDTTFVSFYGMQAGVDYAQVISDTTNTDTMLTVNAGDEAAFVAGDDVYVRLGQALYDSAEPAHFYFAKVLSVSHGSVELDRPTGYSLSVADTPNIRQRRIIKVNDIPEGGEIKNINLKRPIGGIGNAEFGVHFRYLKNYKFTNISGFNVGSGVIGGQFGENITMENITVTRCDDNNQTSKGRALSIAECKGLTLNNYRFENCARTFVFIEGGCENVRLTNGIIVNNRAGRSNELRLFSLAGAKDCVIDGLKIEGNPCTILQTFSDEQIRPPFLRNVEVSSSFAPSWDAVSRYFDVDHVDENVKLGNVFHFKKKRRSTMEINIVESLSYKKFNLPNGVITKITILVTDKTGIIDMRFARDDFTFPVPVTGGDVLLPAITNGLPFTLPKTTGYSYFIVGSAHKFSNPSFQRMFAYRADSNITEGSKIFIDIEYFPTDTPTEIQDMSTYISLS